MLSARPNSVICQLRPRRNWKDLHVVSCEALDQKRHLKSWADLHAFSCFAVDWERLSKIGRISMNHPAELYAREFSLCKCLSAALSVLKVKISLSFVCESHNLFCCFPVRMSKIGGSALAIIRCPRLALLFACVYVCVCLRAFSLDNQCIL